MNNDINKKEKPEHDFSVEQRIIKNFGNMVNAAFWDIDINDSNKVVRVNWSNRLRRMLGFEETTEDFPDTVEAFYNRLHPEDFDRTIEHFRNSLKTQDTDEFVYDIEYRLLKKTGEYCWYHLAGQLENLDDHTRKLYGIIFDISADKKLKEQQIQLEKSLAYEQARSLDEKTYQLAILSNASSYFRINLSQNRIIPPIIEKINGQPVDYTDKFGDPLPTYEEIIALSARLYVDDNFKESYREKNSCAYLIKCFREGITMPEYICRIFSSSIGWHYRKYVTYLSKDEISGEIIGMSVAYDVTEEYKAKEREEKYKAQLEEARKAADAANRSKTNFLFNMSHDIRTPMNAIKGFTTMAKKHINDPEKVYEYLNKIDISGQQLLNLINQVLEMARIESGKIEITEKPVNIMEEFKSMVTVLSEQAKENGLVLRYSLNNIEHYHIFADDAKMSSLTLNITGNALKYTAEGGIIDYELTEIPGRKPGYATYVFTVADTGIGMSEDYLKKLYEPFSREKNTTVSKIQGTGLGLAIVKNIIDLMEGNIEVKSEVGKGTRFDITLDFRIDENARPSGDEPENIKTVTFKGRRVLLVDDNEMNREIAADILEDHGLYVEEAEDGDVAVEKILNIIERKDFNYYDFVLMDIQMPRMNGYEATKVIRAILKPHGIHIPIIAMTANAFEEDRKNAFAAGMDEHLAKPIDVPKMFKKISRLL